MHSHLQTFLQQKEKKDKRVDFCYEMSESTKMRLQLWREQQAIVSYKHTPVIFNELKKKNIYIYEIFF